MALGPATHDEPHVVRGEARAAPGAGVAGAAAALEESLEEVAAAGVCAGRRGAPDVEEADGAPIARL